MPSCAGVSSISSNRSRSSTSAKLARRDPHGAADRRPLSAHILTAAALRGNTVPDQRGIAADRVRLVQAEAIGTIRTRGVFRGTYKLLVYQRVGFRGASGQRLRPDL